MHTVNRSRLAGNKQTTPNKTGEKDLRFNGFRISCFGDQRQGDRVNSGEYILYLGPVFAMLDTAYLHFGHTESTCQNSSRYAQFQLMFNDPDIGRFKL